MPEQAKQQRKTSQRGPLIASFQSLVGQLVKNPSAMRKTWVRFLGGEDPLERGMATHSSILAWRIPGQRSRRATVHGVAESDTAKGLTFSLSLQCLQLKMTIK